MTAILCLSILSALAGLPRRKWLGLLGTGLIMAALGLTDDSGKTVAAAATMVRLLLLLTRFGLLAAASFSVSITVRTAPPLTFSQYAGRAMIGLMLPLGLLIYGFSVSLGGQPILGSALKDE